MPAPSSRVAPAGSSSSPAPLAVIQEREEQVMPREFCPRCGVVRNMEVTASRRKVVGKDGTVREVVRRALHCETCRSFVRSEEAAPEADADKR